jgi:hypothetical protein
MTTRSVFPMTPPAALPSPPRQPPPPPPHGSPDLGSSLTWPTTGMPGMDGGPNGMLSPNCSSNPFCNASVIVSAGHAPASPPTPARAHPPPTRSEFRAAGAWCVIGITSEFADRADTVALCVCAAKQSCLVLSATPPPPHTHTYTRLSPQHVNYCDGGSFANHNDPVLVGNYTLHFRGATIFDTAVALALELGMSSATDIILKGCSGASVRTCACWAVRGSVCLPLRVYPCVFLPSPVWSTELTAIIARARCKVGEPSH